MSPSEARALLSHSVIVEEKLDGANIGISVDQHGELRVQNRGTFLSWDTLHPQFKPLRRWIELRRLALTAALRPSLVLFGEWCYAMHSIHYTRLPDWFLAFDVYDAQGDTFWCSARRDALVLQLGLELVPRLATGRHDRDGVARLLGPSSFADGPAEGIYLRWDDGPRLGGRGKIVCPEFLQSISEHWSQAAIRPNTLA
jgi:ATP-dependent RNA circularization protein (DNA/RNA ligase family)